MAELIFLRVEQIIQMHVEVVAQTGGSHGVRDSGAIESAAAQPRMSLAAGECSREEWTSWVQAHLMERRT